MQGSCATTTANDPSPFTCRAAGFTCLAHSLLLANPLEDFLNSDRASFFCFCCVFCVACGVCGICAVFDHAGSFDQDISGWDVSTVATMHGSKYPSFSRTFFHLLHRFPEGLRAQGSCAMTTAHFPLRIRSKTFLNSDGPRSSVCVVCFVLLVARVGPAQCSDVRIRSTKTLAAGMCHP